MHPLMATRARLLLYLAAWVPVTALLAAAVAAPGGLGWFEAAGLLAPACLVYAFACLSPWHLCRSQPLSLARLPALALTWGAAAVGAGAVLPLAAWAAAASFPPAERKLLPLLPLLAGMAVTIYLLSTGLHYLALALEASRLAERRTLEARTLAREAELEALRAQINPHFLFNSLNSISALATADGARAREMCLRLADFLRGSIRLGALETIPLAEELELARGYLDVERVRFGSRLRVEEKVDALCANCGVPSLLLQPLVENAVRHGIAGLVEGGAIRISARRAGATLAIAVENPFDPDAPGERGTGTGLANARRRLSVRYGAEARLEAGAAGGVYRVELRLPCESPMASSRRA